MCSTFWWPAKSFSGRWTSKLFVSHRRNGLKCRISVELWRKRGGEMKCPSVVEILLLISWSIKSGNVIQIIGQNILLNFILIATLSVCHWTDLHVIFEYATTSSLAFYPGINLSVVGKIFTYYFKKYELIQAFHFRRNCRTGRPVLCAVLKAEEFIAHLQCTVFRLSKDLFWNTSEYLSVRKIIFRSSSINFFIRFFLTCCDQRKSIF